MRLSIETEDGVIFELEDESALVPSADDERATAFEALSQALSLLSRPRLVEGKAINRASMGQMNLQPPGHGYGAVLPFRRP